jgi:hypothetical protein
MLMVLLFIFMDGVGCWFDSRDERVENEVAAMEPWGVVRMAALPCPGLRYGKSCGRGTPP